ncbi:MAG TPA: SPFH domain-containing protein [Planctomycetes bacterium]|nr:SPFH domain-containing protein [Planctomycetota bacterium]
MLAFTILLLLVSVVMIFVPVVGVRVAGILMTPVALLFFFGHFTLQPNEAMVLLLFGDYRGTEERNGFFWANPFFTKSRISKRARNFDGEKLKVNDKRGNPIEISAVVVWRVSDTARAVFDVDDYAHFVRVQSESALRHLANDYAYDHGDEDEETSTELTLRSSADEISEALQLELSKRLEKAGVEVDEARLNHLAYAAEIASAMLRRQQAEAIIAARQKIVHGAVSMVEMALDGLEKSQVVQLDEERKAAMVSNLLVVLCGDSDAQPVINTGTLYA